MDGLLVLDQGSASSRAALMDRDGRLLAVAHRPVTATSPRPGWVEHDPERILESQMAAVRDVLSQRRPDQAIRALGLATQRSTVLLWDPATGRALSPALSWQDRRTADWCRRLGRGPGKAATEIRRRTGLFLSPHYAAPKIRWLLDHVPGARRLARRGALCCGTVNSYLLWQLSHGRLFVTDETQAARTLLYHLTTRRWDPVLLDLFGIPAACLPRVTATAGPLGDVVIDGLTIPVTASLGDQQAALIGLGCVRPGQAGLNYGTGGFFLVNTGSKPRRVPGLLTSIAWSQEGRPPTYLVEGTVNAVGSAFEWLAAFLGRRADWPELDRLCQEAQEVQALPTFLLAPSGLGAPHWDPDVASGLFGLSPATRPEHLVRATVEAVACLMADIYHRLRHARVRMAEIRAGGGVARLTSLLQTQADLLGRPITRTEAFEATLLGAGMLAGLGCGMWTLEEAAAHPQAVSRFAPSRHASARRLYARWQTALRLGRLWSRTSSTT